MAIVILGITSCDSSKRVVSATPKKVIVQEEKEPEVVQIEQVERPVKTTKNHTEAYVLKFAPIALITLVDSYVFYKNKDNLWLVILMHGLYDTWGLTFLFLDRKSPITLFVESLF